MKNSINNRAGGTAGIGSSRRVPGMPLIKSNGRKDRDHEDLILFQELHKREKERYIVSLLQPVSDEFEPNGNYQLYRIASAKKGSGLEFLAENDKNDYDWLKTPPATPLFPSLEMETNGPELVMQREIPILQSLSRFAGGNCSSEAVEPNGTPKSPNPKPKIPVMRCVTPSQRRSSTISSSSTVPSNAQAKNSSKARIVPVVDHHLKPKAMNTKSTANIKSKRSANNDVVHEMPALNKSNIDEKDQSHMCSSAAADFLSSSMALGGVILKLEYSKTKAKATSTTTTTRACFSNEKPPNLRTEQRSASATRGRGRVSTTSTSSTHQIQKAADHHHQPAAPATASPKQRRQSCSPSVSRGRKVLEATLQVQETTTSSTANIHGNIVINNTSQKGRIQTGNGTQVLGSRMVQRVMNARKAVTLHEDKDHKKPNSRFLINESSGFGRPHVTT